MRSTIPNNKSLMCLKTGTSAQYFSYNTDIVIKIYLKHLF